MTICPEIYSSPANATTSSSFILRRFGLPVKLLQRHILLELVKVFTLLVIGLTVMLVFVGLLREATERGLGPRQVLQIMPFVVPSLLPFTIPATLLLAVTVVYGRMAGDLEVTAAKSAGINPLHLLTPAFFLGAILTVGSFALTDRAIPWAITNIETIVTQAMEDIFLDVLKSQHYISSPTDGYSITVHAVSDNGVLLRPTFRYRKADHQQVTVKAEAARVKFDVQRRKVLLALRKVSISVPGRDSESYLDEYTMEFDLKQELGISKPRHLTISDLREQMVTLRESATSIQMQRDQEIAMLLMTGDFDQFRGDHVQQYQLQEYSATVTRHKMNTEVHSRYAMAGSCLFFTLLGGPFAVLQARRQFITSFIMCFLPILLVYYPVMFLMANLCKTDTLAPWWSMWVPNAIIAVAAFFVLRRVIQH